MKTKTAEEILRNMAFPNGVTDQEWNKWKHEHSGKNWPDFAIKAMGEYARPAQVRLDKGRDFLMQVDPKYLTVEDCLEAFGFQRNGLGDAE